MKGTCRMFSPRHSKKRLWCAHPISQYQPPRITFWWVALPQRYPCCGSVRRGMSSWHPSASSASDHGWFAYWIPPASLVGGLIHMDPSTSWESTYISPYDSPDNPDSPNTFSQGTWIRGVYCRLVLLSLFFPSFFALSIQLAAPQTFRMVRPYIRYIQVFPTSKIAQIMKWVWLNMQYFKHIQKLNIVWLSGVKHHVPHQIAHVFGYRSFQTNPKIMLSRLHAIISP